MPALHVLYMQGNPATQKIAGIWGSYRKYLLARLPALTFLNDRPVHKNEQRCSAAWFEGGLESETLERSRIHHEMENANNNSSITNRARIQETVLRRREEIRARRIAMGVDPQVPAFNPRGRISESTPQSEHQVGSADECPSDYQASRAEGEDAGPGDGCKVRYYRLPDGSLLRQTDFTPHDRALAARSSGPAPQVPADAASAGVGGDYPQAEAGEGGVRQGVQLESGIDSFDPMLTPSQRFALHKAKRAEEEDARLAADAAHSGDGSGNMSFWENRYCSASSAVQQGCSTTSSSCVATSSSAVASAAAAAAAAAATVRITERETEREATAAASHGGSQVGCEDAGARRSTGGSSFAPATPSAPRAAALDTGPSRPLLNLAALTPEQVSERA